MFAKGVICAALLAFAAASTLQQYRADHEYVYHYDGQIASSLSNGEQYSASRIRALVKLSFISSQSVIVQLERPQLGKWNEYLDRPEELHKFDKFELVEIRPEHVEKLVLPFQMRLINGKISDVKFHVDDIVFSENVKRSIINALQVQLENPSELKMNDVESTGYSFNLNETTIEGNCESFYSVVSTKKDSMEYNVTKSINFEQCRRRPEFRYNYFRYAEPMINGYYPVNLENEKTMMESTPSMDISSVYEFNVEGDRRQFIVKKSNVLSRYSQVMMDSERVRLVTYSVVSMELKNVERKDIKEKTFSTKSQQTLMYSDELDINKELFIAEGDETYLKENPYMRLENVVGVVKTIMRRLLESTSTNKESPEGIDEHSTRYLTQLVNILRLASKEDIEKIHSVLFLTTEYELREKQFIQDVLTDALAISGTRNCLEHLFKKIHAKEITPMKASSALSKLMNLRLISSQMTSEMLHLCKSNYVQEHLTLKRTCFMTYGAMVNAMCRVESPIQHSDKWTTTPTVTRKYCPQSLEKEMVDNMFKMFKSASTRADRVLALKTLGNMGLKPSLSLLEEIIVDVNIEKLMRIQAIDALRQLRKTYPIEIQRILLPVFQNQKEFAEIRINAVYQILYSVPSNAVIDVIMTTLVNEPSEHVKSFVSQLVYKMASSAYMVQDRENALRLQSALKHFNLFTEEDKIHSSASNFFSTVVSIEPHQIHELVNQLNLATVFGNDSYLPTEIMTSLDMLVTGRMQKGFYQTGIHTQDLEQLIERLYNTLEHKTFDDIVVRGRRSVVDEYNPINMLKSLYNKMKIVTRRSNEGTPVILLYTRWQDMDTSFCLTDEDSLPTLVKSFILDGKIDVSYFEKKDIPLRWNYITYGFEQQTKIATTFGLPIIMTVRMPTIGMIDTTLSLSFGDKTEERHVRNVHALLKGETKLATTLVIKMEVFSPLFTSGIKTFHSAQFRLPLHVSTKLRSPSWMPHLEIHMPKEEIRMIHLQSRPITFYRTWPVKSGAYVEAEEKTMIVDEFEIPLKQRTLRVVDPFTMMNINIDSHWHHSPITDNKLIGDWLLSGENAFEIKFQPTSETAKIVRLSFDTLLKKSDALRNIHVPKFETLFGEYTKEMLMNAEQDEINMIREQIKMASSRLENFFRFTIKAETIQSANPHVAVFDWKTVCDDRRILCVLNADVDIDSEWTWKTVAHISKPELRGIVAGFPTQHFVGRWETKYGSDKKNMIKMSVYGRPSVQKIEELKKWLNTEVGKSNLREYEVFENAPRVVKPNDYVLIVDNKLTSGWKSTMHRLYSLLYLLPTSMMSMPERALLEEEVSKREQILMARLINDDNLNLTISIPTKGDLQMSWNNRIRESKYESKSKNFYDILKRTHEDEAECTVKRGQYIKSFDGKSYKLPMTTCYTVVAKDCTEESKFALMAKKVTKTSDELKLKMITQKKTYELYRYESKMIVKVDGFIIHESEFQQYGIYKIANEDIYELRCDFTSASVRFDGFNMIVKISAEYMNRQCGVCGHYNGDKTDEFRTFDNRETDSLLEFHRGYLYRGEECEPETLEAFEMTDDVERKEKEDRYRFDFDEKMDREEEDRKMEPVRKTLIEETHEKICFSKMPLEQCPRGYISTDSRKMKVHFKCLDRSSRLTREMLTQYRREHIVDVDTTNYERVVEIPRMCVEAY